MPQIFLNNFQTQFLADVRSLPQTNDPATELDYGVLRVSDGAAGMLLNPVAGHWYVLTAFKRSGSLETHHEIMRVTAVDNSVVGECRLTVQRGQEGMAPQAFARGDLLECRLTAGGMAEHVQASDPRLSDPRAPSGPAGGVLSGQFPNPGFAQAMATAADLSAGLAGKVDKVAGKGLSTNDFGNTQAAKLEGMADQATKNATDAQLRDRATHTGTQAISTVAELQAALDGKLPTSYAPSAAQIIAPVHAAASKAVAVDADELPIADSVASFGLKRLTLANLAGYIFGAARTIASFIVTGKLSAGSVAEGTVANAAATGAVTLNCAAADIFELTLTGNTTLVLSNIPALNNETLGIVVRVTQGATAYSLAWFSGITWLTGGGTAPAAPAANKTVEYIFTTRNGVAFLGRKGAAT